MAKKNNLYAWWTNVAFGICDNYEVCCQHKEHKPGGNNRGCKDFHEAIAVLQKHKPCGASELLVESEKITDSVIAMLEKELATKVIVGYACAGFNETKRNLPFFQSTKADSHISSTAVMEDEPNNSWCQEIDKAEAERLNTNHLDTFFRDIGAECFNNELDIPQSVKSSIYSYFNVNSLFEINENDRKRMRSTWLYNIDNDKLEGNQYPINSYKNLEGNYILQYLPVNFYKLWLPLKYLLCRGILLRECKVLELGAGPGTATLSLIEFYNILAKDNPTKKFSLDITSVEKNDGFERSYMHFLQGITKADNLAVDYNFICVDAFKENKDVYKNEYYDLFMESNLLNNFEAVDETKINFICEMVSRVLKRFGGAIFIEPGQNDDLNNLESIQKGLVVMNVIRRPKKFILNLEGNTLFQEVVDAGIRSSRASCKNGHYFTCLAMERK